MTILWEFHHGNHVWLEWMEKGKTRIKRFTQESFKKFIAQFQEEEDELDFLN